MNRILQSYSRSALSWFILFCMAFLITFSSVSIVGSAAEVGYDIPTFEHLLDDDSYWFVGRAHTGFISLYISPQRFIVGDVIDGYGEGIGVSCADSGYLDIMQDYGVKRYGITDGRWEEISGDGYTFCCSAPRNYTTYIGSNCDIKGAYANTMNTVYYKAKNIDLPMTGSGIYSVTTESGDINYTGILGDILRFLSGIKDSIVNLPTTIVESINNVRDFLGDLKTTIVNLPSTIISAINNVYTLISDFVGNFFVNLGDFILGIFVPEEEYFLDWFERCKELAQEKVSLFYYPIQAIHDIFGIVVDASSTGANGVIHFPGVKWENYVIIAEQDIDIMAWDSHLYDLRDALYFVTDFIMVGAFLFLLQNKFKEWMVK